MLTLESLQSIYGINFDDNDFDQYINLINQIKRELYGLDPIKEISDFEIDELRGWQLKSIIKHNLDIAKRLEHLKPNHQKDPICQNLIQLKTTIERDYISLLQDNGNKNNELINFLNLYKIPSKDYEKLRNFIISFFDEDNKVKELKNNKEIEEYKKHLLTVFNKRNIVLK